MDKLTAMRTFVQVVDAGSFTLAAQRMQAPKARVSQRIQALEAALGVRLLQRTTRTTTVTEDGRAYYTQCVRLLGEIENVEHSLRGVDAHPSGVLRVEMLASVARWIVGPVLPTFLRRYPHIELRMGCSDRVADLLDEGIDCAIRGGVLSDSSLVARHVCDVHLGLYAAPGYLERSGTPHSPDDLAQQIGLGWFQARTGEIKSWRLVCGTANTSLTWAPVAVFDDGEAAVAACVAGAGIVLAPPFAVARLVREQVLHPVLPQWSAQALPLHVVYPSSKHLAPRVRCFVDWVISQIQQHPHVAIHPSALAAQQR